MRRFLNFKNRTIKILQLVTERQYRGAQIFAAGLSALLVEKGHEVLFTGIYPLKENVLSAKGAENGDLGGKKIPFDVSLFFRLMKFIKKTKPDIIQANGSDTLKYLVAAKLFYPKMNLVYRNISMVSAYASQTSLKRKINRLLFKKVDYVTSVGHESLNDLIDTYDFPRERTQVINRGVPQIYFDAATGRKKIIAEYGFPETDFILFNAAKFVHEKNQRFLVESFEQIVAQNKNVRLLLVGEGELQQEVKDLVAEKKLNDHIFFPGYRNDVQELMSGSDLFVLGSTIEGVPGVILEAGLQGLPLVAVHAGGVNEVVMTGKTGILLDKHNAREFSEAVLSLIENEPLRKTLGANAKAYVEENYTFATCLKKFESLYEGLLKEKANSAG